MEKVDKLYDLYKIEVQLQLQYSIEFFVDKNLTFEDDTERAKFIREVYKKTSVNFAPKTLFEKSLSEFHSNHLETL